MTKITIDLARKPNETTAEHLARIEKEYFRLPGQGDGHREVVVINAEEMRRVQPTKEDLKRTKKLAKEALRKLRK